MTDHQTNPAGEWDRGWEEHELHQLLRMAALPFEAKLEWLEGAQALAEFIIAQTVTRARNGQQGADEHGNPGR